MYPMKIIFPYSVNKLPSSDGDHHFGRRRSSELLDLLKQSRTFSEDLSKLKTISEELFRGHSRNFATHTNDQYERVYAKLLKNYSEDFYGISRNFETWASRRRVLISKLHTHSKSLEKTKEWCEKGKFTFSTLAVLGSAASIVLDKWTVLDWAPTTLMVSTAVGSLSLVCSLIEIYKKKNCVEDTLRLYEADREEFEELERKFKRSKANTDLRTLFPHDVDFKVLKNDLEMFKSNKRPAFKDQSEMIFFAILASNVRQDPALLKDKEFISKVKKFSVSKVAKIWWNRLMYKNSSYHSEKSKLYKELKSSLQLNPNAFPVLSLAALPVSYSDYVPALGVFILHSVVTFDAFCEITVKMATKEATNFKRLIRVLNEEYDELIKVYNVLTPYNE